MGAGQTGVADGEIAARTLSAVSAY